MGLLTIFKKDKSERWAPYKLEDLVLDLRYGKLNEIKLGDGADSIERIGKPDNSDPFSENYFKYKDAGLLIGIANEKIDYFSFSLVENPYENINAISFTLIDRKGNYHTLSHDSDVKKVEEIIGPSKEQFFLEEGEDREFVFGMYLVTVEFDNYGKAVCFDIAID